MGKTPEKGLKPIAYEEIVENMFLGMTIEEQCKACGAGKLNAPDHRRSKLIKILRVYNVTSILSGIPCSDPGFTRLPVPPAEFKKISELIKFEEEKLKIPELMT